MKTLSVIISIVFFYFPVQAKNHYINDDHTYKGIGLNAGYCYQGASYVEGNLLFYYGKTLLGAQTGFSGIFVGYEYRLAPIKMSGFDLGVTVQGPGFGGRLTLNYNTDFRQGSLQLSPEAGLSINGYFYLFAGFNWTFINKEFWNNKGFRLSAGFNLYEIKEMLKK